MARTTTAPQVRALLEQYGTLYAAAVAAGAAPPSGGRAPAYVLRTGGDRLLVRHYHRGGAIARVLHDRYVRAGISRSVRELSVSVAARRRGIATPAVIAALDYPAGMFVRYDIATQFLPNAHDLVDILFADNVAEPLLDCVAALIQQIVQNGMMHRDLNLRNILISNDRAWVIDLDRCVLRTTRRTRDALSMQRRLLRSMDKWERIKGRQIVHAHRVRLEQAFHA